MTFAAPDWLWLLALVPALWWLAARQRRGGATADPDGGGRGRWLQVDGRSVRPVRPDARHRWRGALAAIGVALGVVALAQPQWGEGEVVRFDQGREVLIALDLSRSMLADDVPPSRLDRARLLIESTLDELRGERVGLLLFAGTAFLQSPLSADHEVLRELLPVLEPGYLPQGGTDFDAMVDAALEAFSQTGAADRFLVVLSDGESPEFSDGLTKRLADAGVRVVALGIGTETGALIPDGRGGIMKDDRGAAVLSRLERHALEALAAGTDGVYVDAASWVDLASLVERTVSQGREGQFIEERERARIHRFQWWLAPALLVLLMSHVLEVPAPAQSRRLDRTARPPAAPRQAGSVIAAVCLAMWIGASALPGRARASEGAPQGGGSVSPITAPSGSASRPAAAPEPAPLPVPGSGDGAAAEPAPDPVVVRVEQLLARPELSAVDYAEFARLTVSEGFGRRTTKTPLPLGAVEDGLAAVELGEELDASAADWSELRSALNLLAQPPPRPPDPPAGQKSRDDSSSESGESGSAGANDEGTPSSASQSGEQGEGAEGGESADPSGAAPEGDSPEQGRSDPSHGDPGASKGEPGADPGSAAQQGERPPGDPQAMTDASAGFGDLDEDRGPPADADDDSAAGAEEPAGHAEERVASGTGDDEKEEEEEEDEAGGEAGQRAGEPPPSRMVGGTRSANEALLQSRPDLASAIGRMERVREGDAPAVLFDRMNRSEGQVDEDPSGGQDW